MTLRSWGLKIRQRWSKYLNTSVINTLELGSYFTRVWGADIRNILYNLRLEFKAIHTEVERDEKDWFQNQLRWTFTNVAEVALQNLLSWWLTV